MRATVVVPTFNEIENIERLLREVRAVMPAARVLVVDDGSPDGTADTVDRLAAELGSICSPGQPAAKISARDSAVPGRS